MFHDVKFIPDQRAERRQRRGRLQTSRRGITARLCSAHLETVHIASDWNLNAFRFPVQWVNRPNNPTDQTLHDFRGLSGQIASGIVRKGQEVVVLPAGIKTHGQGYLDLRRPARRGVLSAVRHALPGARHRHQPRRHARGPGKSAGPKLGIARRASAGCTSRPLQPGKKYFLKHATQTVQAVVTKLESRINMTTLEAGTGARRRWR